MTTYQPIWIRGRQRPEPYQRESADRYAVIRQWLSQFHRPFSVLDLGANAGYFSIRIAEDFPQATVIAIDDKPVLRDVASANGLQNLIVIPRRLAARCLTEIARCEYIDAVLALNVVHHMSEPVRALDAMCRLAGDVLVETPSLDDGGAAHPERHAAIVDFLSRQGAAELGLFDAHTTDGAKRRLSVVVSTRNKQLVAQTLQANPKNAGGGDYEPGTPGEFRWGAVRSTPSLNPIQVTARYESCTIRIARPKAGTVEERDFVPGMNLWNWALLGGYAADSARPARGDTRAGGCIPADPAALIRAELDRLAAEGRWMDDLRPWNFILTHDGVRAIDLGWKRRTEPEPGGLETCLAWLDAARRASAAA